MTNATPGPWEICKYHPYIGYDCMTGGIQVGPAILDGKDYGQISCKDILPESLARMQADAHLISAAPELLAALESIFTGPDNPVFISASVEKFARAAIAKAKGGAA